MLKRFGIKQFASKAVLLSALLATGATVIAQSTSSVTLELFNVKPSESSQATASLEIGSSGGNLQGIEIPEKAGKARYMRAKVATASGVENFVYRVIGNPNNGRIFIITPERKAIALNKFLASTGLEVGADKTVKLGSQVDFASTNATVMESGSSTSQVAGSTTEASTTSATASTAPVEETTTPAESTTATDSSTTGSTPADASATTPATTTPAADSSTATPADPSTTATTEASTTPATTATPDATATPTGSSTAPATDANATPATPAADATAPATDANAAAPASSTASTEAAALTAPVSTTVGKVELTVIPAGATAPASSEKNLILAPVADATEAKSSVEGNTVTLSYTSSSSIDDVSKFYDDQLKAQGFTPDATNATNQTSADQFVKVYKRGSASMTMSVKSENGAYLVEVDLESLANGN
jgi:hypothetical protein